MTSSKHRFVGTVGELCKETFGGVAQCALGYGSSLHYSDQSHPYKEDQTGTYKGQCVWRLQNNSNPGALLCGADVEDPTHDPEEDEPEADTVVQKEGWLGALIGMPDVAAEAEGRGEESGRRPETLADMVPEHMYPDHNVFKCEHPDCVRDAREATAQASEGKPQLGTPEAAERLVRALAEESGAYAWGPEKDKDMRLLDEDSVGPLAAWQKAIRALESVDGEVLHGPWPVRRFKMPDGSGSPAFKRTVEALETLGMDYTVQVWRPDGAEYCLALVTWDWANGIGTEAVCDELAAMYDES